MHQKTPIERWKLDTLVADPAIVGVDRAATTQKATRVEEAPILISLNTAQLRITNMLTALIRIQWRTQTNTTQRPRTELLNLSMFTTELQTITMPLATTRPCFLWFTMMDTATISTTDDMDTMNTQLTRFLQVELGVSSAVLLVVSAAVVQWVSFITSAVKTKKIRIQAMGAILTDLRLL